ncbi:hypothetical protein AArcSl_2758 [Halalkaliarchaeum desulfuricum]|uniref:Uncharacterized protein n=2 Tax=Halalkaliarchaeum desulfuricum TaxID=2055893 RepID=A0A343TMQ1_9EURY|nr:hypothetical protein AArcSl_2758 [Halalkaliarchaeum desulfuricum]
MLTAGVLTPIAVVVARGLPADGRLGAFAAFVVLAILALLFREALRRRGMREDPAVRRRLLVIATVEAAAILLVAGGLAIQVAPVWILATAAVPAVVLDVRVRNTGWPIPLGGELSGLAALSVVVPAGSVLLGLESRTAGLLWLLFLAFHVGSVIRVQSLLSATGPREALFRRASLSYHGLALLAVTAGWYTGPLGLGAPVVFAVAGGRTWVAGGDATPALKTVGRREGLLSTLFVASAPWLVVV